MKSILIYNRNIIIHLADALLMHSVEWFLFHLLVILCCMHNLTLFFFLSEVALSNKMYMLYFVQLESLFPFSNQDYEKSEYFCDL